MGVITVMTTHPFRLLAGAVSLAALLFTTPLRADLPPSMLPAFGSEGAEFTTKSKDGNVIHGWLPNGWVDNSEWAPVTATYSQLEDRPDEALGAVRIKLEKLDDGLLQITSYHELTFQKGKPYRVFGWLRSAQKLPVTVSIRQANDPYESYFQGEVGSDATWKPFEFSFTPEKDTKALVMLSLEHVGTLDVAGITVAAGGPPASFLPVLGTEGMPFTTAAKDKHVIKGWLPTDWVDNSDWAAVDATYSRLDEVPEGMLAGLRIKVENVVDGQLQLTSYAGERDYAKGQHYQISGWIRSPERQPLSLGARMSEEPYTSFNEGEIATTPEWKQFTWDFQPAKDYKALIMLVVKQPGTVDLAGLSVGLKK